LVLRALAKKAAAELAGGKLAGMAGELLAPIEALAADPAQAAGGPARAIFRAPGFLAQYPVSSAPEGLVIASHFHLTPFIAEACAPQEMLVLALSTKRLQLYEYAHGECRARELPAGVPASLEEAGQFNRSEAHLSNRRPVGASAGDSKGVRFGTTTDRESTREYLHDFFETVHRGLKAALAGRPLLLLGVKEEIASYRRAAGNGPELLDGDPGNADFTPLTEIAAQARVAGLAGYYRSGEAALAAWREMSDRRRAANGIRAVLPAAAEGRVHQLCLRADAVIEGEMPSKYDRAFRPAEDLANAAAAETLRSGGEVFVLPPASMPVNEAVAAVLRY
jgi:hypothetical protein